MMFVSLTDRPLLERFLRRDAALHLYSLGDLDERFFGHTRWYGHPAGADLQAVVLLYTAFDPPILLALASPGEEAPLRRLLTALLPDLPRAVYCHLTPGLEEVLQTRYRLTSFGLHKQFILQDPNKLAGIPENDVILLHPQDSDELQAFYDEHSPGHAFDPRLLDTGLFCGIRRGGQIVCAAGIHVYSPIYRVAALGSVATHRDFRGQGLARQATAHLCRKLLGAVDMIGLNVKADNQSAIALYRGLGFTLHAPYLEILAQGPPGLSP
jgi:ribosomal protein S18 acetylase RimI-like enzyme